MGQPSFEQLLEACSTPTPDTMREVLSRRREFSCEQADHLAYLAGFTHYIEAAPFLGRHGLHVEGTPPRLVDSQGESIHAKVLSVQMVHVTTELWVETLADRQCGTVRVNGVVSREPDGTFVTDPRCERPVRTYQEYLRYVATLDLGVYEEVTSLVRSSPGSCGCRRVYHVAQPDLATANELRRLFCHVGAVVVAPNDYPNNTVTFEKLEDAVEAHEFLRTAVWFVLETDCVRVATDFLDSLGATYFVRPVSAQRDYIGEVIGYLEDRICGRAQPE